jgi:carbonic anhydrase
VAGPWCSFAGVPLVLGHEGCGAVTVVGAVYELDTGRVRMLDD